MLNSRTHICTTAAYVFVQYSGVVWLLRHSVDAKSQPVYNITPQLAHTAWLCQAVVG